MINIFDVLIIGSGPAGVSASLYAVRAGLRVGILSKGIGTLSKAEKIENYYGFAAPISGEELHMSGIGGAKRLGVEFINAEAVGMSFEDNFLISCNENNIEAKRVILATGSEHKSPSIQRLHDFEGRGVSYCATCDAFFFRGKNVAVIGDGNFALHEAETLMRTAKSVHILTDAKTLNAEIPENIQVIDLKISSIEGGDRLERVILGNGESLNIDGLFVALGTAGSTALARMVGAHTDGKNIIVDDNMQTNVPGLFAAGDCTGGLLQISKAVYEGTVAGISAIKSLK